MLQNFPSLMLCFQIWWNPQESQISTVQVAALHGFFFISGLMQMPLIRALFYKQPIDEIRSDQSYSQGSLF